VGGGSTGGGWYSYAPASQAFSCGRATPRWSTVRPPQSAISTAELSAGIVSTGGCCVSSSAALSCGSVCTPPSPQSLFGVTLPPPSTAAPEKLQFEACGAAAAGVTVLPPMIEPWTVVLVAAVVTPPIPLPPVPARALFRASVTPRSASWTVVAV
jgi:hypothetical protein